MFPASADSDLGADDNLPHGSLASFES